MADWGANLSLGWMSAGILLGMGAMFAVIFFLGRSFARRMDLRDRGDWDRPAPQSFPREQVVAVYKRRKRYHRHDRHRYQRDPSRKKS